MKTIDLLQKHFENKNYREIIDLYENESGIHWDKDLMIYVLESFFELKKVNKVKLLLQNNLSKLELIRSNRNLSHDENELFDLYINYKIDVLLDSNSYIPAIMCLIIYKKRIVNRDYARNNLNFAYSSLNKFMIKIMLVFFILLASLYYLTVKNVIFIISTDWYGKLFYGLLAIYFIVLIFQISFSPKRIFNTRSE